MNDKIAQGFAELSAKLRKLEESPQDEKRRQETAGRMVAGTNRQIIEEWQSLGLKQSVRKWKSGFGRICQNDWRAAEADRPWIFAVNRR